MMVYDVIVVGGGLAGLVNAIKLAEAGLEVLLVEKKQYPFHKVCGEYISNEVVPYLEDAGLYPAHMQPAAINQFLLSDTRGKHASVQLGLGGFGISRYAYDAFLYEQALKAGAKVVCGKQVEAFTFQNNAFTVTLSHGQQYQCQLLIGAYGKRARLDKTLNRQFTQRPAPYVGVKYHIKTDFDHHTVALHNFEGGYCGLSRIENGLYNLCYLSRRSQLKLHGSIPALEAEVLCRNPFLKDVFAHAEFVFDKPEVINEVSFAPKQPVENHMLMCGDTAGLITPLCGNGMAMAIHAAKLLSELIVQHFNAPRFERHALEQAYARAWRKLFVRRLWVGRNAQKLFGTPAASTLLVNLLQTMPAVGKSIIKQTHGQPIQATY